MWDLASELALLGTCSPMFCEGRHIYSFREHYGAVDKGLLDRVSCGRCSVDRFRHVRSILTLTELVYEGIQTNAGTTG